MKYSTRRATSRQSRSRSPIRRASGDESPRDETSEFYQRRVAWLAKRTIAGLPVPSESLQRLNDGDRHVIARMHRARTAEKRSAIFTERSADDKDLANVFAATLANDHDPDAVATADDLIRAMPSIRWLWPGWIPRGMVTMIFGKGDVGKSYFVLLGIARAVMEGKRWPCGAVGPTQLGKVLWADTENTRGELAERINKSGMKRDRLILPSHDVFASIRLDIDRDFAVVREAVLNHHPDLVVIDSVRGSHRLDENSSLVVGLFSKLAQLAQEVGCAVVVIHHVKKLRVNEEVTAASARGSTAHVDFVRSAIAVDKVRDDDPWSRVRVVKLNLGTKPNALSFKVVRGADVTFGAPPRVEKRVLDPRLQEAKTHLHSELASGEKPAREVERAARKKGIVPATLRRAREQLGITTRKKGKRSFWTLPTARAD